MSFTEFLSDASDRLFESSVSKSARRYSTILKMPDHFIEMLLLIEDKRFSFHCGVDPLAIARAFIFNFRGGTLQGASTISQQIYNIRMRQISVDKRTRTVEWKIKQSSWALYHSAFISKASLLREYIDTVYWGKSLYGIDKAARAYFRTDRESLSTAQSFFLAERIAMPNRFSINRISSLVKRRAIRDALHRRCTSTRDIALVYQSFCGWGGEKWQLLER
jgi:membrane peptidoglycan carboxypeptidase